MRVWLWFLVLVILAMLSGGGHDPQRGTSEVQALGDGDYHPLRSAEPDRFWCYGKDAYNARHQGELPCADIPNYERRSDALRD